MFIGHDGKKIDPRSVRSETFLFLKATFRSSGARQSFLDHLSINISPLCGEAALIFRTLESRH